MTSPFIILACLVLSLEVFGQDPVSTPSIPALVGSVEADEKYPPVRTLTKLDRLRLARRQTRISTPSNDDEDGHGAISHVTLGVSN
eukprot:CAMPEP_0119125058 /NCGR_PEP_ID=MMETSP1310-20130426/4465_1 /TAXON_ID=464262 /ORGANISM="Genus nov. species nov., Strain RCC2339" /LENGTH=85 /DNA_ID=CAMNT_0007115083 /DNA_START=164 /DNA_END=418 /DNA_ORIENTATION=-